MLNIIIINFKRNKDKVTQKNKVIRCIEVRRIDLEVEVNADENKKHCDIINTNEYVNQTKKVIDRMNLENTKRKNKFSL